LEIERLTKLENLLRKDKFADREWEKRGLTPSSTELCLYLDSSLNRCIELLIGSLKASNSGKKLKGILKQELKKVNKSVLDTEEKEFVADYFFQLSQIINISFKDELNSWLYGSFLNSLIKIKEFINPESVVEILSQNCSKCNAALETYIIKKEEGIPDYNWEIIQCKACKEYNLLDMRPNIKQFRKGNYEFIESLSKEEFTPEKAKIRLEQIRYFRNK